MVAGGFFKRLFSSNAPTKLNRISEHLTFVTFKISGVNDNELKLLANSVKTIETLDLEGTKVSNLGVLHLTGLNSLKELRLINCNRVNDGCLPFLNKLTSLQCLYLNGTDISVKGLLYLNELKNLRLISISITDSDVYESVLWQLSLILPKCKIVVNDTYFKP